MSQTLSERLVLRGVYMQQMERERRQKLWRRVRTVAVCVALGFLLWSVR